MNTPHPNILPQPQSSLRDSRRGFLTTLSVLPVALSAARLASRATAASAAADTLPRIRFGPHSMSRLV
ncbi:MAG: hypothetical protein WC429_07130, partial [Verrucomicrobiia bacterium]